MGDTASTPPAASDAAIDATTQAVRDFIARWRGVTASELSTSQSFVIQLCELLGVEAPHPTPEQSYMFERPITFTHGDGSTSAGRIDCYRRGHFVWESKKLKDGERQAAAGSRRFDDALLRARTQAENYARALPAAEGRPPFVVVVDVGHVIELYAEFTRSGATYTPFPDPRSHRIRLEQLADSAIRKRLKALWTDPLSLDPSRASARVTREVAAELAELAKSLEAAGHTPHHVAGFLTRCLFSMFAEDVGLLPKSGPEGLGSFVHLLRQHREQPATLAQMLKIFWAGMDAGGFNAAIAADVLRFNGKLFKGSAADGYVLPLSTAQIDGLLRAGRANWTEVEPAIFGTLLERALDPTERHALGAHYTPRAYVERLVLPTVVEPLRADWANAQAAAHMLAREAAELEANPPKRTAGTTHATFDSRQLAKETKVLVDHERKVRDKWREAQQEIRRYHHQLCTARVLDPACGSGNFLYVTLEHLKRLEGEVLNQLGELGEHSGVLADGETVTLKQFLGIELNPRAAAVAELVLWIGWLQWHVRTQGSQSVAEPVVHDYGNIENRDAVLAYDRAELATDESGQVITRWDGTTFKKHPVTGEDVPDEAAQVPQWRYVNPRPAEWPAADFIVGNPPFIGAGPMRAALGDGYVEALRATWTDVPESADFVMYWWHHAAWLVRSGAARRFGFITTNSLRQTFNRRVVQAALDGVPVKAGGLVAAGAGHAGGLMLPNAQKSAPGTPRPGLQALSLIYAIPDHPWVDSANGAAVRIAMTVGVAGEGEGRLLTVCDEREGGDGEVAVRLAEARGLLHADLRRGANVAAARALLANAGVSSPGVKLHGAGFIVSREEAGELGLGTVPGLERHVREYRNGRDLMASPRDVLVIDLFGLNADEVRVRFPAVFQWVVERVKPERDAKANTKDGAGYAAQWWLFGKPRQEMRRQLAGLHRYIATVETAKHRTFQFLDASVLPDNMLIAIATDDGAWLGVLSSQVHVEWALAAGGTLEDRPRYNKSVCFETFPFPSDDTGLTPDLTERIRHLAEQLDAHRKARQAAFESVTLTGLYNVLDKLRRGEALSPKEKVLHEQGLVSVLRSLHDELDAAVLAAYGWSDLGPVPWADEAARAAWTEAVLERLVALNARRAAEEAAGTIRWLRPDFQDPARRAEREAAAAQAVRTSADELLNQERPVAIPRWEQPDLGMKMAENEAPPASQVPEVPAEDATDHSAAPAPATAAQPWPAALPEQVRAVAQLLAASPAPLPLPAIEAGFKGKGPWKKGLPRILDTLEALGRARREGAGWRG
ncbi:class I SAM-dependent DNA methyltransferase [Candidatus Skiveiella danica]|uniref:class I SAM-dependent DNA methyltransferase n=1 Tax=Candidatus Skiveiella danica TaxID=3386177 RepID=UPI0039B83622